MVKKTEDLKTDGHKISNGALPETKERWADHIANAKIKKKNSQAIQNKNHGTGDDSGAGFIKISKTLPKVRHQGVHNTCVPNAIAAAIECITSSVPPGQALPAYCPLIVSRMGIYAMGAYRMLYERKTKGTTEWVQNWKNIYTEIANHDVGLHVADALIAVDKYGVWPEDDIIINIGKNKTYTVYGWPYTDDHKKSPITPEMFLLGQDKYFEGVSVHNVKALKGDTDALKEIVYGDKTLNPYSLVAKNIIYDPIAPAEVEEDGFFEKVSLFLKNNQPIIITIEINNDFLKPPIIDDEAVYDKNNSGDEVFYHAVLVLGCGTYKEYGKCFYIQNSWGEEWAKNGRCYLTENFIREHFWGGFAVDIDGF